MKILIKKTGHANCDSLPLRFGLHFDRDTELILANAKLLKKDEKYPDRLHYSANFDLANCSGLGNFVNGRPLNEVSFYAPVKELTHPRQRTVRHDAGTTFHDVIQNFQGIVFGNLIYGLLAEGREDILFKNTLDFIPMLVALLWV